MLKLAGARLDKVHQVIQRLKGQGLPAGGVLHLPSPEWATIGPGQS